ncbi:helix-turn-helix transcriptional regulator [Sphingomonas sp. ac-8]|uniref:helix-turn-helix transcriptional regulator n=1 Tax=Sphingomonas sp. ac-8 TaxID=3242977 RepID=UPI003A8056CD
MVSSLAEVVHMASHPRAAGDRPLRKEAEADASNGSTALAAFVQGIGRDLGADGVFAAAEADGLPGLLFAGGACDPRHGRFHPQAAVARLPAAGPALPIWTVLDETAGGGRLLTLRIAAEGDAILLGFWFAPGSRVLQRRAHRRAIGLASAIGATIALWRSDRANHAKAQTFAAALDSVQHGAILLDRATHVRFVNAAARALLARCDGVHLHGRMLCAERMGDTARLQTALSHAAMAHAVRSQPADLVVTIRRKAGRPLIAAIVPHGVGHAPQWLAASLFLFDPDEDLDGRIEPACRLYALSPVETRLACRLASGACLTEAAIALNVREQTARSYLKQIFAKTGTHRQAQLVAVLLRSAVRTAAGRYAPLA